MIKLARIFHHYADVKFPFIRFNIPLFLFARKCNLSRPVITSQIADSPLWVPPISAFLASAVPYSRISPCFIVICRLSAFLTNGHQSPKVRFELFPPLPPPPPKKKTKGVLYHYRIAANLSHTMLKRHHQLNFFVDKFL